MRRWLAGIINPVIRLLERLRQWNPMAHALCEPSRKRRRYQHDSWNSFLC